MRYAKPYLPQEDQIHLLSFRGFDCTNKGRAFAGSKRIGAKGFRGRFRPDQESFSGKWELNE